MRRYLPDLGLVGLLFLLPLLMFWSQTVGGKTLIPTENLYRYEPFATYREQVGAPAVVHNELVSDLILQNYQWKSFLRHSIDQREIPLWNPYQFSGIPFMAAGQQSTFYPLSVLYYVLPLTAAYGWFTVVNLWLAGVLMLLFMRGLGVMRIGGLIAGITYQLCGFLVVSAVHPMIIGAAVWLPLILLMVEFIIRQQPLFGRPSRAPWLVIGAAAIACNIFAGHPELTIYTLLIAGYFAAARLVWDIMTPPLNPLPVATGRGLETTLGDGKPSSPNVLGEGVISAPWLLAMIGLGIGLAAVQFIPMVEFASTNHRAARDSLDTVLGFAHPLRDGAMYLLPNIFGGPTFHSYTDAFTGETVQAINSIGRESIDWGMKNAVEGALYIGILPLILAVFGVIIRPFDNRPPYRWIFLGLVLIAATFMFGFKTYALVYYVVPGVNQLNTAFRWVYGVTVGLAVLAGFGADALARLTDLTPSPSPFPVYREGELAIENNSMSSDTKEAGSVQHKTPSLLAGRAGVGSGVIQWLDLLTLIAGLAVLGLTLLIRTSYDSFASLFDRVVNNAAKASDAFSDGRMLFSFAYPQLLTLGVILLLSGVVLLIVRRKWVVRGIPLWQVGAVVLIAADLLLATHDFNPASDPALLDFTPPSIQWLLDREAETGPFRTITLEAPGQHLPLFQANSTMRYGLDDVRGYESIISKQYVDYMRQIQVQPQLDFNRIAPLYLDRIDEIDWARLSLLNVRYVIAHRSVDLPEAMTTSDSIRFPPQFTLAYEDEAVKIWETYSYPRAFVVDTLNNQPPAFDNDFAMSEGATIWQDTGREKMLDLQLHGERPQWLIISETYAPGWRAFIRPHGAGDDAEKPLDVTLMLENLQGVALNPPDLRDLFAEMRDELPEQQQTNIDNGVYTLRVVYSPTDFQVGMFGSVISTALLIFIGGVWLWRLMLGDSSEDSSGVGRVARNSIAPILLNLFNRGIDFAFAFVMLRILGPEEAGIYYYAIIIFVWFDIFTNFGLDVFLIREASRDRQRAGFFLLNTSSLRLFLVLACVPLLIGFVLIRQATVDPALTSEALLAIGLLYIGLAPGSISKGLTSLFYAFEKAEYPAAVTTITTINKAVFGLIALLLGYGIVGLAVVSIGVNVVTLVILLWAGRELLNPTLSDDGRGISQDPLPASPARRGGASSTAAQKSPNDNSMVATISRFPVNGEGGPGDGVKLWPDRSIIRSMVSESWPLMLNHFLATVFFQIDIVILEAIRGARIVGQYSVAYRWLLALNIIPAFFTQALLPVMSRQAENDRAALRRTYTLGVKMLVVLAVPLAVIFTFMARGLVLFLGGPEYMPAGAIALQIMIWSIPIGWINSLTQYALIAVDLQRRITRAFVIAVSFNIITNLIFIPQYGYQAAAVTTIFSEAVLLLPFGLLLQGALGKLPWLDMIWRPILAGAVMLAVMGVTWPIMPILGLFAGSIVYPIALLLLRPLNAEERAMLMPLLPGRVRGMVMRGKPV